MKKILSLTVFIAIFSLVSYTAGFTLDKCLTERSNITLVAEALKLGTVPVIAQLPSDSSVLGESIVAPSPTPDPVKISQILLSCQPKIYSGYSVVNYYLDNKLDYSFDSRTQDALTYGIKNYTGTADQNSKLLQYLTQKQVKICLDSN
ncbi:hypothetical protein KBC75_01000 [Candidatus Shapirobacteria bacterium]|nr:hypothetical protein [Candidatus Shapirobacteria bacterium]